MSIFTLFLGKKGTAGVDGIDGIGVADVDAEPVDNPLLSVLFNNKLSQSAVVTASRSTSASYVNRYGVKSWARAPTVTNYLTRSNDFAAWADPLSRWSYVGTTAGPVLGDVAAEINLDVDTDNLVGKGQVVERAISGIALNEIITVSFYIKIISGTVTGLDFGISPISSNFITLAPTTDWQRIVYPMSPTSAPEIFEINPRGKAGARVALFASQIESGPTASSVITTTSAPVVKTFTDFQIRDSDQGVLLENQKTNIVNYSNNLNFWSKENCTITQYNAPDAFNHSAQNIKIVYESLPNCSVEGVTTGMVSGATYNVSFYAYLTAGSLVSFTVELGGGAAIVLDIPPVTGFKRFSVKAIAGADNTIKFKLNSPSLTAQLVISSIQVEADDLTSYIFTSGVALTREEDEFNLPYAYNFPAPNLPFTLSFKIKELPIGSAKKYVFSNGLTTTNEFSLYYENENLVMNNGGNLASHSMTAYIQVGLVYDGTNLKFYGQRVLVATVALANTSTIGTIVHIGSNGAGNNINAYLSNVLAYNSALSHNNMLFLQGL